MASSDFIHIIIEINLMSIFFSVVLNENVPFANKYGMS